MKSGVKNETALIELDRCSEVALTVGATGSYSELVKSYEVVHDRYRAAGYIEAEKSGLRFFLRDLLPTTSTLVTRIGLEVMGTASAHLRFEVPLPAEELFPSEVADLLASGKRILESTKFATLPHRAPLEKLQESQRGSRGVLGQSLLDALLFLAHQSQVDEWLIIVNPKHVKFYVEQMGFRVLSLPRRCPHVAYAPGVLLSLDMTREGRQQYEQLDSDRLKSWKADGGKLTNSYRPSSEEVFQLLASTPRVFCEAQQIERKAFQREYPNSYLSFLRLIEQAGVQWLKQRIEEVDSMRLSVGSEDS